AHDLGPLRPAAPRLRQPDAERVGSDGWVRVDRDRSERRRAGAGRDARRPRARDPRGAAATRVRAVLHDEAGRDGPRSRAGAVLLDLMMPGGPDGLTVLEQLKQIAPHVPVIMMSGKANLADAVRATKLGAFQFLEKPLTPEGVLTTLRAAVALSRTLAENRRL